jgi:hypothetical protein
MKRINLLLTITILFSIFLSSCEKSGGVNSSSGGGSTISDTWSLQNIVYYNNAAVKIGIKELTPEEEQAAITNKTPYNIFYREDKYGPDRSPYLDILASDPSTGGIWRMVGITFIVKSKQRQFYNASDVVAAASGDSPIITLNESDQFFAIVPEK